MKRFFFAKGCSAALHPAEQTAGIHEFAGVGAAPRKSTDDRLPGWQTVKPVRVNHECVCVFSTPPTFLATPFMFNSVCGAQKKLNFVADWSVFSGQAVLLECVN